MSVCRAHGIPDRYEMFAYLTLLEGFLHVIPPDLSDLTNETEVETAL